MLKAKTLGMGGSTVQSVKAGRPPRRPTPLWVESG
jgi:hypothetical protein